MKTSIINAVVFCLLAAPISSAPTREASQPRNIQKRSFKVERVRNENFTGRNGPKALYKALKKHHLSIPPGLAAAMRGDHSNKPDVNGLHSSGEGAGAGRSGDGDSTSDDASDTSEGPVIVTATVVLNPEDGTPTTTIIPSLQTAIEDTGSSGKGGNGTSGGQGSSGSGNPDDGGNSAGGNANGSDGTGLVTATPVDNDSEFISPITIGGQTINVDFDSGSSDLWVFSTRQPAADRRGHQVFDEEQSNTFEIVDGAEFSIRYGDGSFAEGVVGTDVVDIGGVAVQRQAVQLATRVDDSFVEDTANNGLLGLAFSNINTVSPDKQKTFFDNIIDSLDQPVFTADLRPGETGAYEFGRVDEAKFDGDLTFVAVDSSKGFWQFTSDKFTVGNGQSQTSTRGAAAIADTGTTLLLVDPNVVDAYYSQVQGASFSDQVGGVIFPCDADLPDLTLDIENGQYQAVVKGEFVNFAEVGRNRCFGGIQASDGLQIYGDIFFKSQFVVFNGGNESIGFAPHVF